MYKEEAKLKKELALDDKNTIIPRTHIDDEYNQEFYRDPMILLTTSRGPTSRMTQFVKEMALLLPNSLKVNRGHYHIKDLIEMAQKKQFSDIVILHEHRGEPDGMIISHMPYGPTLYLGLSNAVLRHDLKSNMGSMSLAYPHLIFEGFTTPLGERIVKILKHLFPIPKSDSKRVFTFSNKDDIISFRHHQYDKSDYKTVELSEIGPRFELKPYQILLGTMNMPEATKEWVLKPYMNTAQKRNFL